MKALIIGATGATGRDLVQCILQDVAYTEVIIFVRRTTGIAHPKLKEIITNFDEPAMVASFIQGDVLFSCLGTTLKQAGSKNNQRHIDYEIPLQFAAIARRNAVEKMVLLSSYGARANSSIFYSQIKGQLEDAIAELYFTSYTIFRPGLLLRKGTDRAGERISTTLIHFFNKLGILKKFRPMPTTLLAEKMAKAPKIFVAGKHIVELNAIFSFG